MAVAGLDERGVRGGVGLELGLGDELAEVDAAREGLEAGDVAGGRGAVVLGGLAAVAAPEVRAHRRQEPLRVEALDLRVDVDVVGVQDPGVGDRPQERLLQRAREERVLVRRLVPPDQRLQLLLLPQVPVHEAEARVLADLDRARLVDALVQRELHPLDQVERDGVF